MRISVTQAVYIESITLYLGEEKVTSLLSVVNLLEGLTSGLSKLLSFICSGQITCKDRTWIVENLSENPEEVPNSMSGSKTS